MKLSIVEYGKGIEISEACRQLIDRANSVIRHALHINRNALVISDGKLRALGIAGKMRLSRDTELEIIPKMLDPQVESDWRASLFLLAALSKYGSVIASEHIRSGTSYKDSLYDIAGRIMAREYAALRRKPIRQYRREGFYDYSVDGEIDFERIFERNPDGVPQERVSFDRANPYNAAISSALKIVLPYVVDASIRLNLIRAVQELGRQPAGSLHRLKVPARNREWTELYNLSLDVVAGMGGSLENGEIMSPGFMVDTWRIWEWLVTVAFRVGLGSRLRVVPQAAIPWGRKRTGERSSQINVYPDVAIYAINDYAEPVFLVDAKYKSISEKESPEIDRSDLYEAFAFCHAAGAKRLFLAYPTFACGQIESGHAEIVSSYEMEDVTVSAVKVALGSITKQGELTAFCRRLSDEIVAMAMTAAAGLRS